MKPDGKGGWTDFLTIPQADTLTTGVRGFDKTGNILYFEDSRGRDTGALTTLDLKTGEQKVVAANDRADAGGIMAHPTENTIQAVSFDYDRLRWQFFDKEVEADFDHLKSVADGDITVVSRTLDDRQWIVAFLMDNGPVRYYHYDRPTKKERFLFTNRDELAKWPLQKMHPVVIRARDGLDLVSYLTLPPGTEWPSRGSAATTEPRVRLRQASQAQPQSRYRSSSTFTAARGHAIPGASIRTRSFGPIAAMPC